MPEACNFIKNETLAQVFSCKFCKISKNTFSYRTLLVAASVKNKSNLYIDEIYLVKYCPCDFPSPNVEKQVIVIRVRKELGCGLFLWSTRQHLIIILRKDLNLQMQK